ncbi:MAG TPA: alcohol dehydrogenase catalytic domain-containing protein [Candidatus Dormibacteraeota bacterium]|nr:alcohol dehydrogenase catalytic domain-containing protein [Candidatus Dormibacteraeota bacterium]
MKAVSLVEAERLEVVDLPAPEPEPGEVLLRVGACGICGSDLTSYKRGLFIGVPGHEVAGVVEAVGEAVAGWSPGQAAVLRPGDGCGACDECRSGSYHRCIESLTGSGAVRPGGYAELLAARADRLQPLADGLAPEVACLAEPLSVAIHGIQRVGLAASEDAIVLGLGSIGLLATAALRWLGAGRVLGVDPVEVRRELARGLGAHAVVAGAREVRGEVDGAPLVLECSGRPEAIQQAIDLASPGGRVALLGIAVAEVTVIPVFWITREITVTGSINSRFEDFDEALRLLVARPEVAGIVTDRVALSDVPATFQALLHPSGMGKVVIDPRK